MHDAQTEVRILREKNRSINSTITKTSPTHNYKYLDINNKVYKDIKNYIQEKENLLKLQVIRHQI